MYIRINIPVPQKFAQLTCHIIKKIPGIRTVQLVKLIYFVELEYLKLFGEALTEVPIVRIDMGPVPDNYKSNFNTLKRNNYIETKKEYRGTAFYAKNPPKSKITSIELETIDPIIKHFKEIIKNQQYHATEILKGHSYQTKPMRNYSNEEEKTGKMNIGGKVLVPPYFTDKDIDSRAEYRRAYRNHLRCASKYSKEDIVIDNEIFEKFAPLLEEANAIE